MMPQPELNGGAGSARPLPDTTDLTIRNPRTGLEVGRVATSPLEELSAAVATGVAACVRWSTTPPAARGLAVREAAGALAESAPGLARLNEVETGRDYDQSLAGIAAAVDTLLQYAELGPLHRGRSLKGSVTAVDYTVREPHGLVAVVTPWNDPVAVAAGIIGAALVTGNTVIHKPSERCPHVGLLLGEILAPAFPEGVLQTVTGDGRTGAHLISLPEVSAVVHVGSSQAGERIARAALLTGAHVVRENGGNDALIVDAGIDARWAAGQAALGAFANTGQICTSVERIFVHRDIAEAFIHHLTAEARKLNDSGDLAPLVDDRMRDEVASQVSRSLEQGAEAAVGGFTPEGPGSFYPATVLLNCDPSMPVMLHETFGPVAPVRVVDSFSDALREAAADAYGLAATVLTASMEHAHRAAAELPVGTVKVNAVFGGAPGGSAQPRKASGRGFGYGPELLDELTRTKVVHIGLPTLDRAGAEAGSSAWGDR
jgi:betaine-aldehyde dehydrogenase